MSLGIAPVPWEEARPLILASLKEIPVKREDCREEKTESSNHGWGCNVMQILIFVNCDTKIACLGKLDRSNLLKPAFIIYMLALKTP